MILIFWLITVVLLSVSATLVITGLLQKAKPRDWLRTIIDGIREGWRGSGFLLYSGKYPVELYYWNTCEDEDVCPDCHKRSDWSPMDIADWMKHGLPGTKEACTECGESCRCELVLYPSRKISRR